MIESTSSPLVSRFFAARGNVAPSEDFRGVMYVPEEFNGRVMEMHHVAVAIGYNNWVGRVCSMHTIVQRPELVTRRMIREAFEYAFNVAGCEAVLAAVDTANEHIMNVVQRLGFRPVLCIKDGGDSGDLLLHVMHRADCPWLRAH